MSKFTAGKWDLDPLTGEIRASGTLIAKVYGATAFNHSQTEAECQANARLILSAPAMYEALQTAIEKLAGYEPCSETHQKLKAILREVEGDV